MRRPAGCQALAGACLWSCRREQLPAARCHQQLAAPMFASLPSRLHTARTLPHHSGNTLPRPPDLHPLAGLHPTVWRRPLPGADPQAWRAALEAAGAAAAADRRLHGRAVGPHPAQLSTQSAMWLPPALPRMRCRPAETFCATIRRTSARAVTSAQLAAGCRCGRQGGGPTLAVASDNPCQTHDLYALPPR